MAQKTLYPKIDLSSVDRAKIKSNHGIETIEKIKLYDEFTHSKEVWAYSSGGSELRCFWDHHPFSGEPISCPLYYRSRQVAREENGYIIKENIVASKHIDDAGIVDVTTEPYYEVDGVFCSPECCLAWIHDQKTKADGSKYADSERLLNFMLQTTSPVLPANSFRLLKAYGGNLSIDQFRKSNKNIKYELCGTTVLISHLFEKKINLSTL